jgi:hypothetical protein
MERLNFHDHGELGRLCELCTIQNILLISFLTRGNPSSICSTCPINERIRSRSVLLRQVGKTSLYPLTVAIVLRWVVRPQLDL